MNGDRSVIGAVVPAAPDGARRRGLVVGRVRIGITFGEGADAYRYGAYDDRAAATRVFVALFKFSSKPSALAVDGATGALTLRALPTSVG